MVRLKNRYLLLNILFPEDTSDKIIAGQDVPDIVRFHTPCPGKFNALDFRRLAIRTLNEMYGEIGSNMIGSSLQVKYFSQATATAILKVSRDHYRLLWSALTMITHLDSPGSTACVIQVVRVSGTIRKAEEEGVKRAREALRKANTDMQKLTALDQFMDLDEPAQSGIDSEGENGGSDDIT